MDWEKEEVTRANFGDKCLNERMEELLSNLF